MNDFYTLNLHDDQVENQIVGKTLSVRNYEDSVSFLRGHSVGYINKTSNNWIEPEVEEVLHNCTRTFTSLVRDQFLALHAWEPWRKCPDLLKIRLASKCLFLVFDRPVDGPRLNFTTAQIDEEWVQIINRSQDVFTLKSGHITSGSPDGGCIQYVYTLK